ncbi:MAG: DUF5320 domain-containing protein [Pseudomonadota bacterium]
MPGGDGTGPMGQGSMTGRGMGVCAGYSIEDRANVPRSFFGAGRGGRPSRGGRGRRYENIARNYPTTPKDEKSYVQGEIKELEKELDEMKKYLTDLQTEEKK